VTARGTIISRPSLVFLGRQDVGQRHRRDVAGGASWRRCALAEAERLPGPTRRGSSCDAWGCRPRYLLDHPVSLAAPGCME
jgi:hypothetical protein